METNTPRTQKSSSLMLKEKPKEHVKFYIDGQLFGMAVDLIEDILRSFEITPIPLSPPEIVGALNLRGRIVTVINMRQRLGFSALNKKDDSMSIVLEFGPELYSLVVDSVSEVIDIFPSQVESCPKNLSEKWKEVAEGVFAMENEVMVILDVDKLLFFAKEEESE